MSDIIVGCAGADCAIAALEEGAKLAKGLGDKVILVFGYAPGGYGGGEVPTHREAVEELGKEKTAEGMKRAAELGVEAEVEMAPKHPAEALMDTAAERGARMIVVGSRGEAPLKGVVIGSTPYKLLHLAEVPVLVVPA